MKRNLFRFAGLVLFLTVLGSVTLVSMKAQDSKKLGVPALTTNWVGYAVYGKDSSELAGGGPYPSADRRVEIGLRSDGVVIWRRAASIE
jgi:hypothetical protein